MLPVLKSKSVLILIGLSMTLAACTKKMPTEYEYKNEVENKSVIDTQSEYLYSASMQNASKSSQDALPFSSSENKRVKLEWTESSLKIMEMEKDARFQDNTTNNKLVLEIPVDHLAYECAKDSYGDCTNRETEKKDTTWDKKGNFKVKLGQAKSGELDLLPIMISQTVGENCYTEVSSLVKGYTLEADAINFQVERTFKTNINCLGNVDSLSEGTITAVFHYSLVKLNSILTKGFKTVDYPRKDENTFGMFSTQTSVLDIDNNNIESNRKLIMNHWNPNRTSIDYYLSDEFDKPANAKIKAMTHETVARINEGLVESGAKFTINLKNPAHKVPGDIRNSMIILVEDPVASSVIGYGPQTEDPVTGEIISARTVMFLGTIKKYIKYTYDDILRAKASARVKATGATAALSLSGTLANRAQDFLAQKAATQTAQKSTTGKVASIKPISKPAMGSGNLNSARREMSTTKIVNKEYMSQDRQARLKFMMEAKNCAFAPNADEMATGVSSKLISKFPDDAKAWDLLTEKEKQAVIDIILPEIWVPTLIHELGHNLGLRHNFEASKDKDNYYDIKADQAIYAKHGIDSQKPFSSVMDYGNDLKMLPIMGRYDIAALRFAYARKVEVVNDDTKAVSMVDVKTTLNDLALAEKQSLKTYGYCTDENVGANPGCERFDDGATLLEIVKNHIKEYGDNYKARNFRNGRVNMSRYEEHVYAARMKGLFEGLRMNAESYENMKRVLQQKYGIDENAKEWDEIDWLKDLKDATLLTGQFMMDVLKTPSLTCAVAEVSKPNQIIMIQAIEKFDSSAVNCFDITLNEKYKIVAQTGKMFNSMKAPNSTNSYMDQIDVRGIWTDKLMALRTLFARQIGSYSVDKYTDNYTDIPGLAQPMMDLSASLMLNSLMAEQTFVTRDGQEVKLAVPTEVFDSHVIQKQIHPVISKILGVPHRDANFQELVGSTIVANMENAIDKEESGKAFADAFRVLKMSKANTPPDKSAGKFARQAVGDKVVYAFPENLLALTAIDNLRTAATIEKVSQDEFVAVAQALEKDAKAVAPAGASEAIKAVYALGLDRLMAYYVGEIQSSSFYSKILDIMPNAN